MWRGIDINDARAKTYTSRAKDGGGRGVLVRRRFFRPEL
ncbi:MAG: hypothetical protein AVDCRST_MAG64-166 [uncultured Phycisphaerae bacterium]|uniref:Uncharacterized protein n=1 Tax=uncultured Phycisphaerae bacterium TaxID=904963 RepID=A0A6J4N187_9BACT|nr:MAG: hypothetical protein AVDCRST_MAG64-166 [uncultured Phycisphaerae bacterium]